VPFPVQAQPSSGGTRARPRGILVLLPYVTWQGRNPLDDDGDGAPNLLDLGVPARAARVFAGGLPAGFARQEAPAMAWLDANRHRYDLTTDLALLDGPADRLAGYRGVLIPGDARWLPARVRTMLRTFVRDGGTLVSLGTDSLRRSVGFDPATGRLVDPSAARRADLFGARLGPVVRRPTELTAYEDDPSVELFLDASLIPGVGAVEPTRSEGDEATVLASAVTPDGTPVFVAAAYGRGMVIRPGLPDFASRLSTSDPVITKLMARLWTLLSRS
jgi:hypothetical protein